MGIMLSFTPVRLVVSNGTGVGIMLSFPSVRLVVSFNDALGIIVLLMMNGTGEGGVIVSFVNSIKLGIIVSAVVGIREIVPLVISVTFFMDSFVVFVSTPLSIVLFSGTIEGCGVGVKELLKLEEFIDIKGENDASY